jgi:hypothetical protein
MTVFKKDDKEEDDLLDEEHSLRKSNTQGAKTSKKLNTYITAIQEVSGDELSYEESSEN